MISQELTMSNATNQHNDENNNIPNNNPNENNTNTNSEHSSTVPITNPPSTPTKSTQGGIKVAINPHARCTNSSTLNSSSPSTTNHAASTVTPEKPPEKPAKFDASKYDVNRHAKDKLKFRHLFQDPVTKMWGNDWWEFMFDEEDYQYMDYLAEKGHKKYLEKCKKIKAQGGMTINVSDQDDTKPQSIDITKKRSRDEHEQGEQDQQDQQEDKYETYNEDNDSKPPAAKK